VFLNTTKLLGKQSRRYKGLQDGQIEDIVGAWRRKWQQASATCT
jgi:hypothetical protein